MWTPASSIRWQKSALCAKPINKKYMEGFFSPIFEERNASKNLCYQCPVRKECLQWALESRQVWGVWGGRDERELRRALSVSHLGEETRHRRFPNCPYCMARPNKLSVHSINTGESGRWNIAKIITCAECGFNWKSRTSANAVEAYHVQYRGRLEKEKLRREALKKRTLKKAKSTEKARAKSIEAKKRLQPLLGVVMPPDAEEVV